MVYRSTNPLDWDDLDDVYVAESAPAPSVQGVAANVAILVGAFQRGPESLEEPGDIGALEEMYGRSSFTGNLAIKNKKFGSLKISRVVAAAAAKASLTLKAGLVDTIKFEAKYRGAYGNGITVQTAAGSSGTTTYTITDTNPNAVLPAETYANVEGTTMTAATFAASKLINATILSSANEPDVAAAAPLTGGADGTIADTDYQTALAFAEAELAGNVVFFDVYNTIRNGYLKTHVANCPDKMAVLCEASESTTLSTAMTDVGNLRDTEGRLIFAFNHIKTVIDGAEVWTHPASWVASIISQTPPWVDPASVDAADFMAGATGVYYKLSRSQFIQAKNAGIAAFEMKDGYIKLKSGITTQIADSSKVTILRRRMADYLTNSIGKFLTLYSNKPNKAQNRKEMGAGMMEFVTRNENEGVLPKDSEVKNGKAKLIDTESLNTDSSLASGMVKIKYKQRIFSSMRYIVLIAEIGESVVVTEE
jgi:hypothetical protein